MKTWMAALAAALLAAAPVCAQNAGDSGFIQGLSAVSVSPGFVLAAKKIRVNALAGEYARDIAALLGWYGQADARPGLDPAAMSAVVVKGLKSGAYDGVIFGESHGNAREQAAARLIIGNILASGVKVGAFLSEATQVQGGKPVGLFAPTQFAKAGVPTGLFVNQFNPEPDVARGLKMAGPGLLVTYTGSAHTSRKMRDFVYKTLKESDLHWEKYFPGRPTVEESFLRHGKRPIIVAMLEESTVLDWIEYLELRDATKDKSLEQFRENLIALDRAWKRQTGRFAPRQTIGFIQAPGQPNLYLGIAPTDRRPLELEALEKAASESAFDRWLGAGKVASAESEAQSSCSALGACNTQYQVYVYSGPEESLPACAYGPVKAKDGSVTKPCFDSSSGGFSGQYGDVFARVVPQSSLP
ncbi:MAG: hypothetical protein KGI84_03945 [Elusimicrobia bacterium]|nr:hypothetical protein [Elusimicrobiota bacterium]